MTRPNDGFYRVKIRRGLGEVRPEAELVDGKTYYFHPAWPICEGDHSLYIGEWAMQPDWTHNFYPLEAPAWISYGDLEFVNPQPDTK